MINPSTTSHQPSTLSHQPINTMKTKLSHKPKGTNLISNPSTQINALTKGVGKALKLVQERQKLTQKISTLQIRLMQCNRIIEELLQQTGGHPYLMHTRHCPNDIGNMGYPPNIPIVRVGVGTETQENPKTAETAETAETPSTHIKQNKGHPQKFRGLRKLKTGRRGKLKSKILKLLSKKKSMRIKDIAKAINKDQGSVFTWFSITGKTTPGIKKVAKATYSFDSSKL